MVAGNVARRVLTGRVEQCETINIKWRREPATGCVYMHHYRCTIADPRTSTVRVRRRRTSSRSTRRTRLVHASLPLPSDRAPDTTYFPSSSTLVAGPASCVYEHLLTRQWLTIVQDFEIPFPPSTLVRAPPPLPSSLRTSSHYTLYLSHVVSLFLLSSVTDHLIVQ